MKHLKEKMIALGLKPKREFTIVILTSVLFLGLGGVAYFFYKEIFYPAIALGIAFVFDFIFLTRYSKMLNAKNVINLQEFATLFGFFRIYLHNGFSVYSALKELLNFANNDLKNSLAVLIKEIDEDKSVQPFIKFGKQFNEIIVEEMMISIYQLIDDGESSNYLVQFELIFDKFSDLLYGNYLRSKDKKLGAISSAPLVGSSFLIIVLTLGVIGIIGEVLNGI